MYLLTTLSVAIGSTWLLASTAPDAFDSAPNAGGGRDRKLERTASSVQACVLNGDKSFKSSDISVRVSENATVRVGDDGNVRRPFSVL